MGLPRTAVEDDVLWITIDRPEAANALRIEDLAHIADSVRTIAEEVRAIAFTASGDRAFSAGMHLDTFRGATPVTARRLIAQVGDFLRAVRTSPVPSVAVLNGVCVGAGFELALACDLRVAHPGVRLGLPEVKLGIPSVVDAALLQDHIGLSKAREVILTGELYPLAELGENLANRMVPADQLGTAARDLLSSVTAPTREVIAAQKLLFETWLNQGITSSVAQSVDVFGDVFEHPATLAAIEAYQKSRSS